MPALAVSAAIDSCRASVCTIVLMGRQIAEGHRPLATPELGTLDSEVVGIALDLLVALAPRDNESVNGSGGFALTKELPTDRQSIPVFRERLAYINWDRESARTVSR